MASAGLHIQQMRSPICFHPVCLPGRADVPAGQRSLAAAGLLLRPRHADRIFAIFAGSVLPPSRPMERRWPGQYWYSDRRRIDLALLVQAGLMASELAGLPVWIASDPFPLADSLASPVSGLGASAGSADKSGVQRQR